MFFVPVNIQVHTVCLVFTVFSLLITFHHNTRSLFPFVRVLFYFWILSLVFLAVALPFSFELFKRFFVPLDFSNFQVVSFEHLPATYMDDTVCVNELVVFYT